MRTFIIPGSLNYLMTGTKKFKTIEMKEEDLIAMECLVHAQSFVEALDRLEGTGAFKHQLKSRGKMFCREVDRFLDSSYDDTGVTSGMIELIEKCQENLRETIKESVYLEQ